MQKIRFVINDIARIFRLGDRDVPFNVRSVVALIFFLLDSLELFSSWNDIVVSVGSIIFFYLQFLFQFVLLQSVFLGSVGMALIWGMSYYAPFLVPSTLIPEGLISLAFMGFIYFSFGLILVVVIFLLYLSPIWPGYNIALSEIYDKSLFLGTLFAFLCFGQMMFNQRRRTRISYWIEGRERQLMMASELHDIACNDVVFAMMRLDIEDAEKGYCKSDMADVRRALANALACMRGAIAELRHEDEVKTDCVSVEKGFNVKTFVDQECRRLESLGYVGTVMVSENGLNGAMIEASVDRIHFVENLLREIFGNIVRHADSSMPYVMVVGVGVTELDISIGDKPIGVRTRVGFCSGGGMRFYSDALEYMGGSCCIHETGELWSLRCVVPLR